ncbi:hypothetical protein F0226_21675 [Vibrio sp. 99-70-13A1]|nr:hypothetical protein [Vibrio sp. 99-70-13A1]
MVKSIFTPKKPLLGAFLLIPAPPLVISHLFYFSLQNKRSNKQILEGCECSKKTTMAGKLLTSFISDTNKVHTL